MVDSFEILHLGGIICYFHQCIRNIREIITQSRLFKIMWTMLPVMRCSCLHQKIMRTRWPHLPQQVIFPTSTQCDTFLYRAQRPTIINSEIPWMSRVSRPANQTALDSKACLFPLVWLIRKINKLRISHWCSQLPEWRPLYDYWQPWRNSVHLTSKMRDSQLVYIIH